jgi:hypothetical protein
LEACKKIPQCFSNTRIVVHDENDWLWGVQLEL